MSNSIELVKVFNKAFDDYTDGFNAGKREGAKQELLEIKSKLDKEVFYFDLDDKHVLLNYIKERLKDLANENVCVSQKPKVFEELEGVNKK
jgi:hypothetical protein